MPRILYIDNDDVRRSRVMLSMVATVGPVVEGVRCIAKDALEHESYDYIFVHGSNEPEAFALGKCRWKTNNAVIVLFSGRYSRGLFNKNVNGVFRVTADQLENDFKTLWHRVSRA
jgi:hypothetical protein